MTAPLEQIFINVRRTRDLTGCLCDRLDEGDGDDLSLAQQISINLEDIADDLHKQIEQYRELSNQIKEMEKLA